MVAFGFDTSTHSANFGFPVVTAGRHKVAITKSEPKPTKSGDGGYLEMHLTVLEGPEQGKLVILRENLWNPSEVAARIAREHITALCQVCGIPSAQSSEQIHNIPFLAEITVSNGEQGPQNNVKAVYDLAGNSPGTATRPVAPTTTIPQAPNVGGPAWGGATAEQAPASGNAPGWGGPATAPVQQQATASAPTQQLPQQPATGAPAWGGPPPAAAGAPPAGNTPPWGN